MKLKLVKMWLCQACLDGEGEMCHTPGCALIRHKVDLPIAPELYEELADLAQDQEPLGEPFETVLSENSWDLYAR